MKYKLLALDLDGTLLNDSGEISKNNSLFIKKAKEKGLKIILTTGRSYPSAKKYIDHLNIDDPVITYNGALIQKGKETLKKIVIEDKIIRDILPFLKGLDFAPIVYPDDNLKYYENLGNFSEDFYNTTKSFEKELIKVSNITKVNWRNVLRISIVVEEPDIALLHSEVKREFGGAVRTVDTYFAIWGFWIFEILALESSKANALDFICKQYDINSYEAIAVGDNNNDLDMINWAGLGIAMKNGLKNIFREADYVTEKSNNEDAIAEIIKKFILT